MTDDLRDLLPAMSAPEEDILWGQIARAVSGQGTAVVDARRLREAERVWAAAAAARQWQGLQPQDSAAALGSAWRRIEKQEQIPLRVVRDGHPTPHSERAADRRQSGAARRLIGFGAVAAAASIAVAVLLPSSNTSTAPSQVAASPIAASTSAPREVWLADSTRVVLAANSALSALPGYGTAHRTVQLTGEAFVTVAHRKGAPFRLEVAGTVVEDIGTAFVASTEPNGDVRVSVTDGAIRVWRTASRDTVELKQRGSVRVDTSGTVRPLPEVDPTEAVAWSQDRFMVRNATLAHVVDAVRSRYGVTLQYDDPAMGARKLTADFGTDGAGAVAATIAATLGLDLERMGIEGYRLRDPSRPRNSRSAAGN
jgi:transmembrane sensor